MLCRDCKHDRPVSAFYASNKSSCKECVCERARAYRAANLDRVMEYDRNRPNHAERVEMNRERYKRVVANPESKAAYFEHQKLWQMRNWNKRKAHIAAGNAIRRGTLVKQPCERCGATDGIHAHHEDYSRPLDVNWLCVPCHAQRHREINEERRRA
jgi:hypothetical protein